MDPICVDIPDRFHEVLCQIAGHLESITAVLESIDSEGIRVYNQEIGDG
jgi:hypothetical protein